MLSCGKPRRSTASSSTIRRSRIRLHDHPGEIHLDVITKRVAKVDVLWRTYLATYLTAEEKALVTVFEQKRAAWLQYMYAALDAILAGDFSDRTIVTFSDNGDHAYLAALDALAQLRHYYRSPLPSRNSRQRRHATNILDLLHLLSLMGGVAREYAYLALRRINGGLREAGTATHH